MPKTKVVVDTNALIRSLDSVVSNYDIVVPICVMEELDNNKSDSAIGYNCREAIRYIEDNSIEIDIDNNLSKFMIERGWIVKNDNLIIACAFDRQLPLVTGDTTIYSKARSLGMEVIKTSTDVNKRDKVYTGVRELVITDSEEDQELYARIHQNKHENVLEMLINEYVIIKDLVSNKNEIKRWTGTELVNLSVPGGKKGKPLITAKNDHQLCALDLLNDPNIKIKIICGTYGSGKTWLSTKMGLYHIKQSGQYSKLMIVRNPVSSGQEVGFLPGDKMDKIGWAFKGIEDQLEGGKFELESMIQKELIEFDAPTFLKGRSLNGGYFLMVEEAEDLDFHTLKMIGTRLGEDSAIVLSGDWRQAEKQFRRDNGLMQAIESLKGSSPMVGIVVLQEDVRSEASKIFAQL